MSVLVPLSSHPRRGPRRETLRSKANQPDNRRQALREPPRQRPPDATNQSWHPPAVSSRHLGDGIPAVDRRVLGHLIGARRRGMPAIGFPIRGKPPINHPADPPDLRTVCSALVRITPLRR